MGRNILAVVLAIIAGSIFNMALIAVSHAVYPLPEGIDPSDFEAFKAHVEANGMPTGALLIVLVAHAGGSFVSGLVCGLIAKRPWYLAAGLIGVLWACAGIYMLTVIPSPTWFAVSDVVLYVPMALLGVMLGGSLAGKNSPSIGTEPVETK